MVLQNLNFAIVVPCYNEGKRFNLDYWNCIIENTPNIDWLFVDDGSTDNTIKVISDLLPRPNINLLKLNLNKGKSEAIRLGMLWFYSNMENSDFENNPLAIGFIDCDGAFELSDILKFVQICKAKFSSESQTPNFQAIISSRVKLSGREIIRDSLRHYIGRIVVTFICRSWESAPYDTQSGFKLFFSSPKLFTVLNEPFKTSWFFDIEIIIRIRSIGIENFEVWEEPLNSWKEIGQSKIKVLKYFSVLREIFEIRKIVNKNNMQERKHNKWI